MRIDIAGVCLTREAVVGEPSTGACQEESAVIQKLRDYIRNLEMENHVLGMEKRQLTEQLMQRDTEAQQQKESHTVEPAEDLTQLSDEACRKRLERLCKRNRQGRLGQRTR